MPHISERLPVGAACPFCGKLHDAATAPFHDAHMPKADDLGMCFDCGEWSVYQADLTRRRCNDAELDYIGSDPQCRRLREAWVRHRRSLK